MDELLKLPMAYLAVGIAIAIVAAVHVLKRLFVYFNLNGNRFFKLVLLPSLSVILGFVVGLIIKNIMLGLFCGSFASLIYNRVKKYIETK